MTPQQQALHSEWKHLINLPTRELDAFLNSQWGRAAGMSSKDARKLGIHSGRESARAILAMRSKPVSQWTWKDWDWAQRQVSFVKRMSGVPGELVKADGTPTRKYLALLVWGHKPTMRSNAAGDWFSRGYRSWYVEGEWHPLRSGITHALWAAHFLNDPEMHDTIAEAKLMKLGAIKQWGNSFVFRDLHDVTLRIIQNRVQDMVNAHPSGYSSTIEFYFGRTDYLQVTIDELLNARHVGDLKRYKTNGFKSEDRAWYWQGEWYELGPAFHKHWAQEALRELGEEVPEDDAEYTLLELGAIKQWGGQFITGDTRRETLSAIQDRLMALDYGPNDHITVLTPYGSAGSIDGFVGDILEARQFPREYQRNGVSRTWEIRAWIDPDGIEHSLRAKGEVRREAHVEWAADLLGLTQTQENQQAAFEELLNQGWIRVWGNSFHFGKATSENLKVLQNFLMDHEYQTGNYLEIMVGALKPALFFGFTVEDLLTARSWNSLARMTPNRSSLLERRAVYHDGAWHEMLTGEHHSEVTDALCDVPDPAHLLRGGGVLAFGGGFEVGRLDPETFQAIRIRVQEAIRGCGACLNRLLTIKSPLQSVQATAGDLLTARSFKNLGFEQSLVEDHHG